jgi:hypothetical protein
MEEINKKELILSLIQDNLVNLKLVAGLNSLGLIADDYYLNLGDTVFKLMGFKSSEQSDLIFEKVFMSISETIAEINFSDSKDEVIRLSMKIYDELVFAKGICDGKIE